jgi:metal-responsive CopG/Arc/MetJ family transcriptional regulator
MNNTIDPMISMRLPEPLLVAVDGIAEREMMSRSAVMRRVLRLYVAYWVGRQQDADSSS